MQTPKNTLFQGHSPIPVTMRAGIDRFSAPLSARHWNMQGATATERSHAILLVAGTAQAKLRHGGLECRAPALVWLPVGEARSFEVRAGARGYLLSVAEDLVGRGEVASAEADLPLRQIADTVHTVHPDPQSANLALLERCFASIDDELHQNAVGAATVIAAQIRVILTLIHRLSDAVIESHAGHRPGSIAFQRFLQVLELHFREHWNVAAYANALGISERRLFSATMRATGKPPLALIHDRILREACLRLEQSPLAVAQIAYGLGFRDPAYFSRFFKRYVGLAPGAYRRARQGEIPPRDDSFAAWP